MEIKDMPKLLSPFVREEINGNYIVTDKIAEGYEWVFDDDSVMAVEKLHGTNVSIEIRDGVIVGVWNRTERVPFFNKGKTFITEGILNLNYEHTEQAAFKSSAISENLKFDVSDMTKFKKELQKKLDDFAEKEVDYLMGTKLSVQDSTEKSSVSIVSETSTLSLKELLAESFEEAEAKIESITKKEKEDDEEEKDSKTDDLWLGDYPLKEITTAG